MDICIAMMDTRFNEEHYNINQMNMVELKAFIKDKFLPWVTMSVVINKAYSLNHGYKLYLSDISEYNHTLELTKQHPAWMKPNYILDIFSNSSCDWAVFMDSDSVFYMDKHETSLEDWFSSMSVLDISSNYEKREQERIRRDGNFPWVEQEEYFFVGGNGALDNPEDLGFFRKYLTTAKDYACSGTFLVKNSEEGRDLLNDWINGPSGDTEEEQLIRKQYDEYRTKHSWEQRVMNSYVIPKHRNGTSFFSYKDFAKIDGRGFRHVWGKFELLRFKIFKDILSEIFRKYERT
jgi:galactosyl transferase GMA12/MNN10 family